MPDKPLQPLNAQLPIAVTELGMLMLVMSAQFSNVCSPIAVTEYVVPSLVTVSGISIAPEYSLIWLAYEPWNVTVASLPLML